MILRRAARPMLAAIFISGGIEALRSPQAHARAAKPVLEAVGPAVDQAVEVAPLVTSAPTTRCSSRSTPG